MERVDAGANVAADGVSQATERIALAEQRGQVAGERGCAARRCPNEHVRQSRMHSEAGHGLAVRRYAPGVIECLELTKQLGRL